MLDFIALNAMANFLSRVLFEQNDIFSVLTKNI